MEWMTPVGTALGAVIGVGSTLLADRIRWNREREDRALEMRKQLYADYSAALSRMRTSLNECAHGGITPDERGQRIRELFLEPGAYELRHQLAILAPQEVVEAARTAFLVLKDIRDCLLDGADANGTAYGELSDSLDGALASLRLVMRRDLRAPDRMSARSS